MIDPVIFTIKIGSLRFSLHWYGVLVVVGVLVGEWIAEREMRRRGGDPEHLWEGLIWAIPAGIVGARLWYIVGDMLVGSQYYIADPIRILRIWEGGLHFYGAILLGGLAFYIYARRHSVDMWLILDIVGPSLLIGQGIARFASYINQELYGPPTDLPWGIPIAPQNRIPPWNNLGRYPASTRFHPTFAYEMLWNFVAAALLLWVSHRYEKKAKPGALFAGWLILAGVGRIWIEGFRPDQPVLPGAGFSLSRIVAAIMAIVGVVMLLVKYEIIRVPLLSPGRDSYSIESTTEGEYGDERDAPRAKAEETEHSES